MLYAYFDNIPFFFQVINETLRVSNIISGVFRRAMKDVDIKGIGVYIVHAYLLIYDLFIYKLSYF